MQFCFNEKSSKFIIFLTAFYFYRFQRTTRIPGIIGIVDGFLVTFQRSRVNEEAFFNYRVGSSMNVQIVRIQFYTLHQIYCQTSHLKLENFYFYNLKI